MKFNTLDFIENTKLAVLKLNRPEKRNALNSEMIHELTVLFNYLKENTNVVLLQVVGKGDCFCAGADIAWLRSLGESNQQKIKEEFHSLGTMLETFYSIPQIAVSFVHGSAYGGGLGLLACSDFVISSPQTVFSFSEIKLGLIPATISPYIIRKTGLQQVKKLFYTGERFDENKALEIGLIDQIAQAEPGNLHYETLMETILKQPHHALKALKQLLRGIESNVPAHQGKNQGVDLIAALIVSEPTQQLFNQFLSPKKKL